jgi:hypothetical protein
MSKVYDFNDERKKTQRSDARGKVNVFNTWADAYDYPHYCLRNGPRSNTRVILDSPERKTPILIVHYSTYWYENNGKNEVGIVYRRDSDQVLVNYWLHWKSSQSNKEYIFWKANPGEADLNVPQYCGAFWVLIIKYFLEFLPLENLWVESKE